MTFCPKFIRTILNRGATFALANARGIGRSIFSSFADLAGTGTPLISLSVPQDADIRSIARGVEIYNSCNAPSYRQSPGCYFYNLIRQLKIDELLIAEHRNPSGNQLSRDVTLSRPRLFHSSDRYGRFRFNKTCFLSRRARRDINVTVARIDNRDIIFIKRALDGH